MDEAVPDIVKRRPEEGRRLDIDLADELRITPYCLRRALVKLRIELLERSIRRR